MDSRQKAAIFLLLFSPINAELLTASSPPIEFFSPTVFVFLILFYGTAVLIIHELAIKWHKGWPTIMVLGLAFGVVEEGLVTMSFFNSNWPDIAYLGVYGHYLGVNWVWCVNLPIFHSVWSISVPILVMRMIFPSIAGQRILQRKYLIAAFAIFPIISLLLTVSIIKQTGFIAPFLQYVCAIATSAGLLALARRMPLRLFSLPISGSSGGVFGPGLAGFCFSAGFFLIMYLVPFLLPIPAMNIIMMLLLTIVCERYFEKRIGSSQSLTHKWALFVGLETMFVAWTFVHEFASTIPNTTGMSLVGISYIVFFIWLRRRIL